MDNVIETKSFEFAKRIVKLSNYLIKTKNEFVLSRQIMKSGTSIGANIAEAQNAQSHKDFIGKLSIAIKETNETRYWLRLLFETGYIDNNEFTSMYSDCEEIYRLLSSIILTMKEKDN